MFYIVLALIGTLVLLRLVAPRSYTVYAGIADGQLPASKPETNAWLTAGLVEDDKGRHLDVSNLFRGQVEGHSMEEFGIPDGTRFVAEYLSDHPERSVQPGDVVVAKEFDPSVGPTSYCYCLRRVRRVNAGLVEYEDSIHGSHAPHPFEQVVARVSFVFGDGSTSRLFTMVTS